jgi:hypothetical protein
MKRDAKSTITLPPEDLRLVALLQARLRAKSEIDVIRLGLHLLKEVTDRESLRQAYRQASHATRASLVGEIKTFDPLVSEGLEES